MARKKINFCSNESTLDGILNCLPIPRPPVPPIPAILTLLAKNRTGLSSSKTTASIISKLSEAGIVNSSPEEEKKIGIIVSEIFNAIALDSKLTIAMQPGTPITSTGVNSAGPVLSVGSTTGPAVGSGIIS